MVVFDGYKSEPFNKDFTHYQRQRKSKKVSEPIASSGRTIYSAKSNLFGEKLSGTECKVIYADGDADLNLAKIGLRESLSKNAVVIGKDTDSFISKLRYSTSGTFSFYFRNDKYIQVHDITYYKTKFGNKRCE